MREEFYDIIRGWMSIDDFYTLTEKIELSAKWVEKNGPLEPDEQRAVELMLQTQIMLGWDIDV